jgi:hypothetical protein
LFSSDENEEDEDVPRNPGFAFNMAPFNRPQFNYFAPPANLVYNAPNQPYRFVCRQCPQNKWMNAGMKGPDYTCTPVQNHLLCQCCLEAFPDRNAEIAANPLLPKQNCSMCFKAFCDLYWGCRKGGCKGCLTKFINLNVDNDCLMNIINENQFETQLFTDWMFRKNKNVKDVFNECVQKVIMGAYKAGTMNQNDVLDRVVCRTCAINLFKELAYQYRSDIPEDQIISMNNVF